MTHLYVFTDSTPVVAALQSCNSDSTQLNAIVRWLFQRHPRLQIIAMHQPGKRNGAADGLSRTATDRVLADAERAGARLMRLEFSRTMTHLAHMAMSLHQRR